MKKKLLAMILACACVTTTLSACDTRGDEAQNVTKAESEFEAAFGEQTQEEIEIDLSDNAFSFMKDAGPLGEKDNTVMIYMVGSNLESDHQAASRDLYEIVESGVDGKNTNVVICTGGTRGWWFDIPSDRNTIIRLDDSGKLTFDAQTEKLQNMGEAQTLVDFLNFSHAAYPAKHYSLIFWDHGSGPIQGFCYDEVFQDIVELRELKAALDASAFKEEARLDWIGFDACLMASVEMAGLLSNYTDYLIASQETESGAGWDYAFLKEFNDTSDTEEIADAILTTYRDYFREHRTLFFNPDVTLSCMDLTKIGDTQAAMDALFDDMAQDLSAGDYRKLAKYREQMKSYGIAATGGRGNSLDLVDLGDLADVMAQTYPKEAKALRQTVDDLVVRQVTNVRGASGVSLYYPYNNTELFSFYGLDLYSDIEGSNGYLNYMRAYVSKWTGTDTDTQTSEPAVAENPVYDDMDTGTVTDNEITLQLTPEQVENAAAITYSILMETDEGMYTPLLAGVTCTPDEDGVIHISHDQKLFAAVTDVDDRTVWPTVQINEEEDRIIYQALTTQLNNSFIFQIWGDSQTYHVTYAKDKNSNEVTLLSVEASGEDTYQGGAVSHSGKADVDVGSWDYISTMSFNYIAERDENGRMKAFNLWESDHTVSHTFLKLDRTFHYELAELTEIPGRKVVQVVVRDENGNRYASELMELNDGKQPELVSEQTANGTLDYYVYSDHATVWEYSGTDTQITIPEKVNGVPVTKIDAYAFNDASPLESISMPDTVTRIENGAFRQCVALKDVQLPDGLEDIGTMAFYHCDALETLELPEGVKQIGVDAFAYSAIAELHIPASINVLEEGAFSSMEKLSGITIAGNDRYTVVNGVIYTDNKKTLHTFFDREAESFEIPDGVERIGDYAFMGYKRLKNISYPDSLVEIGDFAFYECSKLEDPFTFPSNLERIGAGAFFAMMSMDTNLPAVEMTVGPNVREIGADAFGGRNLTSIHVVKQNEIYASVDGALTNKAKDYLILVPNATAGTYEIPKGIVTIGKDALDGCYEIKELIIPDGVLVWHGLAQPGDKVTIGAGLMNWEGASYSNYSEVEISEDNESYAAKDNVIFNKDMTVLLRYPAMLTNEEYHVPEGVEKIEDYGISNRDLRRLYLPASLKEGIVHSLYDTNNFAIGVGGLEEINVDENNEHYCSVNGVVYSKDKTILYAVPSSAQNVSIEESVTEIAPSAINEVRTTMEIRIPDGVTYLPDCMDSITVPYDVEEMTVDLYLPDSIVEIDEGILRTELYSIRSGYETVLTIHCSKGSYADTFFRNKGLPVVND